MAGFLTVAVLLCCTQLAWCWVPRVSDDVLRRAEITPTEIADSYDYVIVGGGQAGIVMAARLTEDPDVSVLVIEYGYFNNAGSVSEPSSGVMYYKNVQYNMTSVPQTAISGFKQDIYAACCVGGGSTINGMLLNRGSAADYDAWEKLGNPGWGWEGLYPYFQKSSRFDAPAPALAQDFNMTWSEKSYSKDGPIHLSFSPWQWPGQKIQFQALKEAGCPAPVDGQDGSAYGVFWYPTALDNATVTRSYAVTGYYNPNKNRPGFKLITGWRVDEVLFNDNKHATGVIMRVREAGTTTSTKPRIQVNAKKEIIIAAGALHSPQVLQRSGIGPKDLLERAKIPVLVDLPGVGSNLQDHAASSMSFKFKTNVFPNPDDSYNNATFAAWASEEWALRRGGPMAIATGNNGGEVPLPIIDPEGYKDIVAHYRGLKDIAKYLPATYTKEQVFGYEKQREILSDMMARSDNAWLELPIQGTGDYFAVLIKVLSRGTVLLDLRDKYDDPIVDYNTLVNPADQKMLISSIRFIREVHQTASMQTLGPLETKPGTNITTDEDIWKYLSGASVSSTAHNSGTNAMMPRELGGVVGPDLLVYGVTGLSVADSSIMPILIGAHTCSTVYAIAEKAADIIKARHTTAK